MEAPWLRVLVGEILAFLVLGIFFLINAAPMNPSRQASAEGDSAKTFDRTLNLSIRTRNPPSRPKMVKAPRSKGCRVCVDRRIKCDQTRPRCMRCEKANRQCPGYEVIKFVDEGPTLRDLYHVSQTNPIVEQGALSSSEEPPDNPYGEQRRPRRTSRTLFSADENSFGQGKFERAALVAIMCPTAQQDQLLASFIQSVRSPSLAPTFRCHSVWLSELAERGSQSGALVWAIRAVSLSNLGRLAEDEGLIQTSRRIYGKSLLKLNDALKDPVEGLSTDTLCATVLLSFYEVFNCTDKHSWIKHAGGAVNLIRLRGPDRHRSGFASLVFLASRHSLIMEAFQNRSGSFLELPEWRKLCRDIQQARAPDDSLAEMNEDFFQEIVTHPGYLRLAIDTVTSTNSNPSDVQNVLAKGRALRSQFRDMFQRLEETLQEAGISKTTIPASPQSNNNPFPFLYEYPDIHIASLHCGFWNVCTALNISIMGLEANLSRLSQQSPQPSRSQRQAPQHPQSQPQTYHTRRSSRTQNPAQPQTRAPILTPDRPRRQPALPSQPPTLPSQPLRTTPRRPDPPSPVNPHLGSPLWPDLGYTSDVYPPAGSATPLWDAASTVADHQLQAENLHFAHEICKSAPYMANAPFLGPLFLVMALRMALRHVKWDEEKAWVIDVLKGVGKRMGLAVGVVEEFRAGRGEWPAAGGGEA